MDIKKVREILKKHNNPESELDPGCGCHPYEPNPDCCEAKGYIECHEKEKMSNKFKKTLKYLRGWEEYYKNHIDDQIGKREQILQMIHEFESKEENETI